MRAAIAFMFMMTACHLGPVSAQEKGADPLTVGKNLPSTFHPFNINEAVPPPVEETDEGTGKSKAPLEVHNTKHKFHCLISEYAFNPTVMLLARGLEDNAELKDLLKKLDAAIERNRRQIPLRAFVVFLYDDTKNLTEDDVKRARITSRLDRLAEELNLKNVVIAASATADLEKYKLNEADALTAVLYNRLKIGGVLRFASDKLAEKDSPAVASILAEVQAKFKTRK